MQDAAHESELEYLVTMHGVFYTLPNDLITQQLKSFGAHTRNEIAMVLDHVEDGQTFVDIGAHIGTYAMPVAGRLGARGRCLAIEGNPRTFEILTMNVAANRFDDRIETVNAIVGEAGGSGLNRIEVAGNSGGGHYVAAEAGGLAMVDTIELLRSRGFDSPDFIKVDVEGMEPFVLRSLTPLIERCRPKLYLEIAQDQIARHGQDLEAIDRMLRQYGYRFFRNTGQRNSTNDHYVKTELQRLADGGRFFDLLALPA